MQALVQRAVWLCILFLMSSSFILIVIFLFIIMTTTTGCYYCKVLRSAAGGVHMRPLMTIISVVVGEALPLFFYVDCDPHPHRYMWLRLLVVDHAEHVSLWAIFFVSFGSADFIALGFLLFCMIFLIFPEKAAKYWLALTAYAAMVLCAMFVYAVIEPALPSGAVCAGMCVGRARECG